MSKAQIKILQNKAQEVHEIKRHCITMYVSQTSRKPDQQVSPEAFF